MKKLYPGLVTPGDEVDTSQFRRKQRSGKGLIEI